MKNKKAFSKKVAFAFDLDGTLVDTENHKGVSHKEAMEYFGGILEVESYYKIIGNSFEYVFENLKGDLNISMEDYKIMFNKFYLEKLNHEIVPKEGVIELLEKIYSKKIQMALVTSSEKWMMNIILDKLRIKKYFDISVSSDDILHNKPNPEPYIKAIEFLNSEVVYAFEDTEPGIISAKKAGAIVYGIKNSYNNFNDLNLSSKVYNSFKEIDLDRITN